MLKVEEYARIRLAHRDGMSIREIARQFGHSRRKIREVLRNPNPQPYHRTKVHRPKLTTVFQRQIDEILELDESAPRKQRHTAVKIHRRLQENGFTGGYDQVRRYVKRKRLTMPGYQRETFIPLVHDSGQRAEADFGKIYVDFPGGRRQVSVLILTWAYSNCTFAIALPNEKLESILYGTKKAMEFFGCVPKELWWDNPKTVATKILCGRNRVVHKKYQALASHYNFEPLFCLPARGNEKPHVENRVKLLQRTWATPVPRVADLDELNRHLLRCCVKDQQRIVSGKNESIATRFAEDRKHSLPLPRVAFDPAITHEREVDKYQTVAFDRCRYSVPRRYAFQKVKVKAYVDRVEIISFTAGNGVNGGRVIAHHERSYRPQVHVLNPLHFLETLERKPACLDHTSVYRNWKLPAEISELREYFEQRHGRLPGARQYIRLLQLLASYSMPHVSEAIRRCQAEGVVTAERVEFRCRRLADRVSSTSSRQSIEEAIESRNEVVVHTIPLVHVPLPNFRKFDSFLSQGGDTDDHRNQSRPTQSSVAAEGELEATSFTDDARRIREAGS